MLSSQLYSATQSLNIFNAIDSADVYTPISQPKMQTIAIPAKTTAPAITFEASVAKQLASKMNIIRFVAMCSIVWGHSIYSWEHQNFNTAGGQVIQALMLQMGRLGTIMFFVISGFFISDKLSGFSIKSYLRYRLYSLIIPWIIFLSLFVFIQVFHLYPIKQLLTENIFKTAKLTLYLYRVFIFHATYWFIPVSIISALVLITFKNYVGHWWFGAVLLVITLFYGINLYHAWLPVDHTKAFVGYTFFMWLGIQFKLNANQLKAFVDKVSWSALSTTIILTFFISLSRRHALAHNELP